MKEESSKMVEPCTVESSQKHGDGVKENEDQLVKVVEEEGCEIKQQARDFIGIESENRPDSLGMSRDNEYWTWSLEDDRMMLGWIWYPDSDEEVLSFPVYEEDEDAEVLSFPVYEEDEDEEVLWEDGLLNLQDIKDIPNS